MSLIKRLLDAFRSRSTGAGQHLREPTKPSQAFVEHAQKEIEWIQEQMRNPQPKPRVSPDTYDPILASTLWKGDEYWGTPLNATNVELEDTIDFLAKNRDQSLWFSVIRHLPKNDPAGVETVEWILRQPDCDAVNALAIFGMYSGPTYCGKSSASANLGKDRALPALKIIEARDQSDNPYPVRLGPCRHLMPKFGDESLGNGRLLLRKAQAEAQALPPGEVPALMIPERTLLSGGTGPENIVVYHVDAVGLIVVPKERQAT
jgi:hypothetical protein